MYYAISLMNTVCSAFAHKKRNTTTPPPERFNVNRHIDWILSGIALISNFLCSNAFQFSNYAIFIYLTWTSLPLQPNTIHSIEVNFKFHYFFETQRTFLEIHHTHIYIAYIGFHWKFSNLRYLILAGRQFIYSQKN